MDDSQDFMCGVCGGINGCDHYQVLNTVVSEGEESENVPETTVEDVLISFVYTKPPLWDHTLPLTQRTKNIKEQLWLQVLNEFGDGDKRINLEFLQKKWKNLRDTYLKTKMDIETYVPTGSGAKKRKKLWKHYEALKFLSNVVGPRVTKSSHQNIKTQMSSGISTPGTSYDSDSSSTQQHVKGIFLGKSKGRRTDDTEKAILEAINKVSTSATDPINPMCLRISEILSKMPAKERYSLEFELLKKTLEAAEPFL